MTPKERSFCMHFVKLGVAYGAALKAGYTKQYAHSKAMLIIKRPHVIAEIKRLRTYMDQRADKSATDVVNEFSKIAFTDRISFLKPDPERAGEFMYKSPDELTQVQRDVVEKVTYFTAEIVVIEDGTSRSVFRQEYNYIFSDKAKALEQMGRHFGIFNDKLKLGPSVVNPFTNATQAQLEALRKSWVKTMTDPKLLAVDGEFEEVKND